MSLWVRDNIDHIHVPLATLVSKPPTWTRPISRIPGQIPGRLRVRHKSNTPENDFAIPLTTMCGEQLPNADSTWTPSDALPMFIPIICGRESSRDLACYGTSLDRWLFQQKSEELWNDVEDVRENSETRHQCPPPSSRDSISTATGAGCIVITVPVDDPETTDERNEISQLTSLPKMPQIGFMRANTLRIEKFNMYSIVKASVWAKDNVGNPPLEDIAPRLES